jgi:hypothetical protein
MQSMLLGSESTLTLLSFELMINYKKISRLISKVLTGYLTKISTFCFSEQSLTRTSVQIYRER